ncbi:MAG: hypothetical protein J6Y17_01185 [Elusimicrobiaceae bacterium]|nr:hypothetical protein [Elusimicrobiaceae bacterium]
MKKLILAVLPFALVACGGLNKNTVSYQMSKYDTSRYYVVAGEANTKQEAAANAAEQMQQALLQHTPTAGQDIIEDLMANAKVEKVWKDKQTQQKHYFALSVLPREKANAVLVPFLNQADAQLAGLASQFATPADPLWDLKVAYKMQPIVERRLALNDTYQFLQADRSSYMPDTFAPYKTIFKEKMAAVLVGVDVEGAESRVLVTYVIDALNKMGLGVVDETDPDQVLSVKIETEVDNYSSKKVDGLIWCSSGATISLVDTQRGVTFSRFNVHERAGTSRIEDSLRRSMQAVGEQAATQISTRLENYLKTK